MSSNLISSIRSYKEVKHLTWLFSEGWTLILPTDFTCLVWMFVRFLTALGIKSNCLFRVITMLWTLNLLINTFWEPSKKTPGKVLCSSVTVLINKNNRKMSWHKYTNFLLLTRKVQKQNHCTALRMLLFYFHIFIVQM